MNWVSEYIKSLMLERKLQNFKSKDIEIKHNLWELKKNMNQEKRQCT